MRKDFLVFGKPLIEEAEIREVADSLRSGWLSTGPKVARFEADFKRYIGSKYALALNSCTAGLHLALLAANVGRGDEVITSPLTFAATANVIMHVGARPVFADIDTYSMNIDAKEIERKISKKTKVIMPVHFAGRPCEMEKILDLKNRFKVLIIEDAAHAIEAIYKGRKIGTIADITSFSFYVTKNITTGEGGMVTTGNDAFAERIQIMALHGMSKGAWKRYSDSGFKHYEIIEPGYKYNMMDIQAAIGIHQLSRIDKYLKRRQEIWQRYDESFRDLPVITPLAQEKDTIHARHLYTLLLDLGKLSGDRDTIQGALHRERIGTGIHFIALHLHKFYREKFGYKRGDFPHAEYVSDRTISLPLSAGLTEKDVSDVIKAVKKTLHKYRR